MKNYFKTQEFVSRAMYEARGERSITKMDNRITTFINMLRATLDKPITCNTWLWGGGLQWRGYRTVECPEYKEYSQHSDGRGLDFDVKGMSADEVRQWIIDNRELWWVKPITFLESECSWVHIDCRATPNNQLQVWGMNTKTTLVYNRF